MFRQGESCIQAGDIIDLIKKKNNIVPEAEKAKFHQLLEQNLMTNLPQFSVIFSAYTTLLTVNDEGQFDSPTFASLTNSNLTFSNLSQAADQVGVRIWDSK